MSSSGETSLKAELMVPTKTAEAFSRFLPVISTREFSGPLVGEIRRISGSPVCAAADRIKISVRSTGVAIAIHSNVPTYGCPGTARSRGRQRLHYLLGLRHRLAENALPMR